MKKNKKNILLLIAIMLIAVYFSGKFYYRNKFPKNVYINNVNIGGMTVKRADRKLEKANEWDKITIKSDTEEFLEINAEEISYKYAGSPDLDEIFEKENGQNWVLSIFNDSIYTTPILSDYNKDKLASMIDNIKELDKELLDASVVYSNSSNTFIIEPHSYEIKLTKEQLFDLVVEAIDKRDNELNIERYIEQPTIFEDDKSLIAAKDKANKYLKLKIKYDFGDREELVDASILKDFIAFNGTEIYIDRDQVKEYIVKLARKYDTYGRDRNFRTTKGKNITISGGSYGWVTHRENSTDALIEHIKNEDDKTIEPIYSYKALIRNADDIGNSYVEIDLKEQMVYVYINGQLKVETDTVTGNLSKGHATPTGIYPINYKERDATLTGEDYESPVKYWMPFNNHIGLHDADWRTEFGEDIYEEDGSNGCINLPLENTKAIFDLVYPGMPVIVH